MEYFETELLNKLDKHNELSRDRNVLLKELINSLQGRHFYYDKNFRTQYKDMSIAEILVKIMEDNAND